MAEFKPDRVSIGHNSGCWIVTVTAVGVEQKKTFDVEQYANNYATGQSLRLGVPVTIDESVRGAK